MYASFLDLPVEGRHSRALHLKLFTVPSALKTFYEGINSDGFVKSHQSRHPGESRGPEVLVIPGFRLSPE
jgi:hypothetical protein